MMQNMRLLNKDLTLYVRQSVLIRFKLRSQTTRNDKEYVIF